MSDTDSGVRSGAPRGNIELQVKKFDKIRQTSGDVELLPGLHSPGHQAAILQ